MEMEGACCLGVLLELEGACCLGALFLARDARVGAWVLGAPPLEREPVVGAWAFGAWVFGPPLEREPTVGAWALVLGFLENALAAVATVAAAWSALAAYGVPG